jgi:hypothetical protein
MEVPIVRARAVVFLVLVAFMAGGPFYRHILGGESRVFRPWWMFHDKGVGTIPARFTHLRDDGSEVVLNRYELLRDKRKTRLRKVSEKGVAKRLCEKLGAGKIRIDSRIATRSGWASRFEGKTVDCVQGTLAVTRQ